jgi:hemerythrin-like domain-containing protein
MMARKVPAMSETQIAERFLQGHDEVAHRVHDMSAAGVGLLDILQNDHRAVMDRLNGICSAETDDLSCVRADFLEMKSLLEAHSLAEERVLYGRLKADDDAVNVILEAVADHEMVARALENMGSHDLNAKQWMTLAKTLRELLQEHIELEEGQVFEVARSRFKEDELKHMGGQMQYEKTRIFAIVA